MHRLHVRIFLWFLLGVVVVSATVITLAEFAHSRAEDDRVWRERYGPRVDMWAQQETRILRTRGPAALTTYVDSFQIDPGVFNYIFDADGRDVLGRQAPREVLKTVASMRQSTGRAQVVDVAQRIIAEKIVDARGSSYVVVVAYPAPSILNRTLFEFVFADLNAKGLDTATVGRLVTVMMVAGVFCFFLARHIARPIDRLRLVTRSIANGELEARVDKRVLDRKDELADLGHDLDRMAERIEHLVTAQRQLLADVSHALRSPLARLNVALGLARRDDGPATSVHLDRIERETERLNTLIGQLLTIARMDSGIDFEGRTIFDLGSVVDEVAIDADYEARHRHCTVRFDQHSECFVAGARDMLRGAIENVVRNAVRHTEDMTSVDISMDCPQVPGRPRVVIHVRDHGPGVPGDAVGSLFRPFHRIANGRNESPHGTGLGLAITKRAFEVHGGTATARNATDGGLVVTLELPLHVADEHAEYVVNDRPAALEV